VAMGENPNLSSRGNQGECILPVGFTEAQFLTVLDAHEAGAVARTEKLMVDSIQTAIQSMMDKEAQSVGYDSLLSVCTYATSPNVKFQAEGQYFVARRDDIWTYCYTELAKVEAGTRAMPTVDEFLLELPALSLPV